MAASDGARAALCRPLPTLPTTADWMLYDHSGNPVRSSDLKREQGGATVSGVRSPYRQQQAPGMRPERLARLLRQADEGDTSSYFTLAAELEERDSHYGSVLTTRKLGVSGIPATVVAATDKRQDRNIAEDVRINMVARPEFAKLIFHAMDALGKGISMVEIMWETSESQWWPREYKWRDQRWFTWDHETLEIPLIVTDANPQGEALTPYKWIVHTPLLKSGIALRGGLARPVSIMYALKSYTVRDLMAFLEIYGIPFRYGTYPTGSTEEQREKLLDALEAIGSDASGIVPEGTNIQFANVNSKGGSDAFIGTAEYWDKQVSKRVLGQTMTTDEGTGRGKAQASEQSKQKLEIKRHDAARVAATIVQQLITPYVRLNYGEKAAIPGLALETRTDEELDVWLTAIERFVELGGEVEESVVRDTLGLPEPARDGDGKATGRLLRPKGGSASNESPTEKPNPEDSADPTQAPSPNDE
jgi:phage gp29-like protein